MWFVIASVVASTVGAYSASSGAAYRHSSRSTPESLGIRMKFFETTWLDNPNAHAVICASLVGLLFLAIYLGVTS